MASAFQLTSPAPVVQKRPRSRASITLKPGDAYGFEQFLDLYIQKPRQSEVGDAFHSHPSVLSNTSHLDLDLLQTELINKLNKATDVNKPLLIGSSADPYQPIEEQLKLMRIALTYLNQKISNQAISLVTPSQLILRDLDLLAKLKNVRVVVQLPTDSEQILRKFEPESTNLQERIDLIQKLHENHIEVDVVIGPLYPVTNIKRFAETLADLPVKRKFVCPLILRKRTKNDQEQVHQTAHEYDWAGANYLETVIELKKFLELNHSRKLGE